MRALLATKLNLPQAFADQIVRIRLLSQLNSGLDMPFSLIVGPAGAGKSTIAAAWLRTLAGRVNMFIACPAIARPEARAAWLSLDDGDDEPTAFFSYLLAAIRTAAPGFGQTTFDALARGEALPPKQIVDAIAAEGAALPGSIAVALDDFHVLTHPVIHTALERLIRQTPSQLHFVIISREEPPFTTGFLRDGDEPVILGTAELFFTEEESARFLRQATGLEIRDDLIRAIYERTEGWPAGLRLAALSLRQAGDPAALTAEALQLSTGWVGDYLAEAVFAGQPASLQRFLLYTALPEQFNLGLATALLEEADPLDVMETLRRVERRNLPLVRLDARGEWYRYHTLTREYLLRRLALTATPAEIAALHGRAAAWLARTDHTLPALQHFLAAGDPQGAARLVEARLPEYQENMAWQDLAACIRRLPEDLIQARPGLLLARACLLRWQYRPEAMRVAIEQAADLLDTRPITTEMTDALSVNYLRGQIALFRSSDDYPGLSPRERLRQADVALVLLEPSASSWVQAARMKARLLTHLGRAAEARRLVDDLDATVSRTTPEAADAARYFVHAVIMNAAGPIAAQEQHALAWLVAAQATGNPADALWVHMALGGIYYQMNAIEKSLEHWEVVLKQGHLLNLDRLALIARAAMEMWAESGRLDRAENVLARVRQIVAASGPSRSGDIDADLAAYLALLRGERTPTEQWLAAQPASPDPNPINFRTTQRLHMLLALATPQSLAQATADARALLEVCPPDQWHARNQLLVLLAAALWQRGRTDEALNHYRTAVSEGYRLGHRRVYLIVGHAAREMLTALAADAETAEAARDLAAQLQPRQIIPVLPSPSPRITPLTDRELTVLRLLAERLTNPEIADRLDVSPNTVRNQTAAIFRKLNVSRRQEAVAMAREIGFIN